MTGFQLLVTSVITRRLTNKYLVEIFKRYWFNFSYSVVIIGYATLNKY